MVFLFDCELDADEAKRLEAAGNLLQITSVISEKSLNVKGKSGKGNLHDAAIKNRSSLI